MAMILNVPRDERFGDIGTGIGSIISGLLVKSAEKKKKEAQASALEEVMELQAEDPLNFTVAKGMAILGEHFKPAETARISQAIAKSSQDLRSQEFQETMEKSRRDFVAGERKEGQVFKAGESELGRKAQVGLQEERLEATAELQEERIEADKAAAELDKAFEEGQDILKADREGAQAQMDRAQELQIVGDKITAAADRAAVTARAADERARLDRESRERIAKLDIGISKEQGENIAKVPGLAEAMEAKDNDKALALVTTSLELNVDTKMELIKMLLTAETAKAKKAAGGKPTSVDVILANGNKTTIKVQPTETNQQALDRLMKTDKTLEGARLGSRTEGGVTREAIAQNTGLDLTDPKQSAAVSAIQRSEKQIGDDIDAAFKTSRTVLGITSMIFDDKIAFMKSELAKSEVRDIMVGDPPGTGETDPGKVAAIAQQEGIKAFERFEWVPKEILASKQPAFVLDYARKQLGWDTRSLRKLAMETSLKMTSEEFDEYLNAVEEQKTR